MPNSDLELHRRGFFAAAGMSAYSLFVFADDAAANNGPARSPDEIRGSFEPLAPSDPDVAENRFDGEPNMTLVDLECDVLVAGGGPAGVCAALAAAREGARVLLVQDRSRLGGNSSSEVKMHMVGANAHGSRVEWRESGIVEELRLDDAANNPQRCFELWDLLLYDKIVSEPNCRLILDTAICAAEVANHRIQRVLARCDKSEHLYRISATLFLDCTGDGRLALEAGAPFRWGREARSEFDEPLAPETANRETLGSTILFTARDYGKPMPYQPPTWARRIEDKHLKFRKPRTWEYGYWWIEWGGKLNTIRDNERIRFELLSIVTGVWNHIKNSGEYPDSVNWAMNWVGMMPGKRESRRIEGDHILTEHDLRGDNGEPIDAVSIGGWSLDDHPSGGFDEYDKPPCSQPSVKDVYNIPLRALYSRSIDNLMMAGRNASCSHVAFTSTRVMATCASMGQAAGTAAALCCRLEQTPRQVYTSPEHLTDLQQTLLRNDQAIKGLKNEDPLDLARSAKVTASSAIRNASPDRIIDGWTRNLRGESGHRWVAAMSPSAPWIELAWDSPQAISQVRITFDSGFVRELTLSASDRVNNKVIRAPQPETVRDYRILTRAANGSYQEAAVVSNNHQRLRVHSMPKTETDALRIEVTATNGVDEARIFEVRCYA